MAAVSGKVFRNMCSATAYVLRKLTLRRDTISLFCVKSVFCVGGSIKLFFE